MKLTEQNIKDHPNILFIFGDNVASTGLGGQAKVCRSQPNTASIPTKHKPAMELAAFFSDDIYETNVVLIQSAWKVICSRMKRYDNIYVIPGIGEGLANLPKQAPITFAYLTLILKSLEEHSKHHNPFTNKSSITLSSYYISFGQVHTHSVNGITLDKDCIVKISCKDIYEANIKARKLFDNTFARICNTKPNMEFFPRGIINL